MPSNRYIKSKLNQLKEIPGGLVESMSRSGPPRAAVAPPERVPDMLHRTPRRPGALVEEYVQEQRDVDKLWPNFGSPPVRMPSPPLPTAPRGSRSNPIYQ